MTEVSRVHVMGTTGSRMAETACYQLLLQDSDSADEIQCSSEEDAASPACMQAANVSTAKTSQQRHARVCTETANILTMPSSLAACSEHCQCLQACFALKPEIGGFCSKGQKKCQTELQNSVLSLLSCSQQPQVGHSACIPG